MIKVKVNAELIERIKELRARGKTQEEIAAEVGITQGTVSYLLRRAGLGGKLIYKRALKR